MTREQLAHAAHAHGYSLGEMAWALDPQRPGECGWFGGCHEVADGHDGMCAAHRQPVKAVCHG
jgi:hypothetical protein